MQNFLFVPTTPQDVALFLDIDGTLLDIAPSPEAVTVPDFLSVLLDELSRQLDGALALISGRSLCSIEKLFPGKRDAAGTHGFELRLKGEEKTLTELDIKNFITIVKTRIQNLPGVELEEKTYSLALHFRNSPQYEKEVNAIAEEIYCLDPENLGLIRGKCVTEIVPGAADKGLAIQKFMECEPYKGRKPIFIGDDLTDESGFIMVNRMQGLSIHIGNHSVTSANVSLASPEMLRNWLQELSKSWGAKNQ